MNRKWFAILLALCLVSCRKDLLNPNLPAVNSLPEINNFPAGYTFPLTITVDQSKPGYTIPDNFEGLSFETGLLAENPGFLNENNAVVIQLMKNLGGGILRIGGNTSDKTNWTNAVRTDKTPPHSLTTTEIDRLSAFSSAVGWPVLFGLNLAEYDPGKAEKEAKYVYASIRHNLFGFQFGNEPDVFRKGPRPSNYNFKSYLQDWRGYLTAVRKAAPEASFSGPDITPFNNEWLRWFAASENSNINLVDGHYYVTGPASDSAITCRDILTNHPKLTEYLATLHDASARYNLPFRMSECNSVWGGGKHGVSDVFASSLWSLDFMWLVAENKGQGINFHGGTSWFAYSPITQENGQYVAKAEYYGMLAFKYGAVGQTIVPVVTTQHWYNVGAHACVNANNTYSVTLVNKEPTKNFAVTIKLSKTASNVQVARLMAPGLKSADGITFGGSSVNTDGTFKTNVTEKYSVNQKSVVINLPAASAAIVTIN